MIKNGELHKTEQEVVVAYLKYCRGIRLEFEKSHEKH